MTNDNKKDDNNVILDPVTSPNDINLSTRSVILYALGFTVALALSDLVLSIFDLYISSKNKIKGKFIYFIAIFITTVLLTVFWRV